jgi:hypothetical protein
VAILALGHFFWKGLHMKINPDSQGGRVEREVERERHERMLRDEERTHVCASNELRSKDARENASAANLKRSSNH